MYSEPAYARHPRVPAPFLVKIHTGAGVLIHKARDLSLSGLLVEGDACRADEVLLELPLPKEQRMVSVSARVVRRDERRGLTALRFADLDWDDLFALARYLHPRLP